MSFENQVLQEYQNFDLCSLETETILKLLIVKVYYNTA